MTTARTQQFHVGRGGAARPRVTEPKPDGFTPVSAETFVVDAVAEVVEVFLDAPAAADFDPSDHTVEEVKAYVTDNPDQAEPVLDRELDGKARSGLLSFLENFNTESES